MVKKIEDIENEVRRRLSAGNEAEAQMISQQFTTFKAEETEESNLSTFFEKYCYSSLKLFPFIKTKDEEQPQIYEDLQIANIKISPKGVIAATILTALVGIIISLPFILLGMRDFGFFLICSGLFIAYIVYTFPAYQSQIIKIKAQQESLLALLYMTIYMRVNPVLEKAIAFATEHMDGPLGRDLKRILWLLDSEKIPSIHQGINMYMELWIKRNKDFVKSFMILISVTNQVDREHQSAILDKALSTLLQDTYEKMKYFAHDLKMPVVVINTFGMMLPLIGLIAFPMMSVFMSKSIKMSYLFFGYIVILPVLIFFFSNRIISKRPGAFSAPDVSKNPKLPPKGKYRLKFGGKEHIISILPVAIIVGFLIMIPGLFHIFTATLPVFSRAMKLPPGSPVPGELSAEYELGAMFLTMSIPVGLAVAFFLYFYLNSTQKLQLRNDIIEIEDDMSSSLYQIANQFTENIPVEIAVDNFIRNYEMMNLKKKKIYDLFNRVLQQMKNLGITFEQAIFSQRYGIIFEYPSTLLKEIMWIFTESSRKGSEVIYSILSKISVYLDNVKKIKELIYDLLEETVTSIKSQAKFLSPFIAAIVGSLTLIIVRSLFQMLQQLEEVMKSFVGSGMSDEAGAFTDFINFTQMTPPTLFQVLVGIYTIESVILLAILASGIQDGFDEVARDAEIAKTVLIAIIVYVVMTFGGVVMLNKLVGQGIESTGATGVAKGAALMLIPLATGLFARKRK